MFMVERNGFRVLKRKKWGRKGNELVQLLKPEEHEEGASISNNQAAVL